MPSTYSTDLRIELIANGEKTGTWGTITNDNLGVIIEDAIAGAAEVETISANQALTVVDGAADEARCAAVILTTTTTANFAVYVPPVTKLYVVKNASSYVATMYAGTGTVAPGNVTAAGAGVAIPAGKTVLLRVDTTASPTVDVVDQLSYVSGTFGVGGALTTGGAATIGGPVTASGSGSFTGSVTAGDSSSIGGSLTVGGNSALRGIVSTIEPLYSYSSAILNATAPQTLTQSSAINLTDNTFQLATASFVNGTAIMLSSSGDMPETTGAVDLSTTALYYVRDTTNTSYYTGVGSITGTVLTMASITAGSIGPGSTITGTGVSVGTTVGAQISGDIGGVGTYSISPLVSQTVASTRISGTYAGAQKFKIADSSGGSAIDLTATGSGTLTLTPLSTANTAPDTANNTALATTAFVDNAVANSAISNQVLQYVNAATTSNITLSGTQTIDGVAVVAGNRVLVKDQLTSAQTASFNTTTDFVTVTTAPSNDSKIMFTTTGALPTGLTAGQIYYVVNRTSTTFQVADVQDGSPINLSGTASGTNTVGTVPSATNGIYEVNASTWTRAADANTDTEIAAAQVAVIEGTVNGGKRFVTSFDVDNNIGSSTMQWKEVINGPATATTLGGLRVTVSGTTLNLFTY